MKAGTFVPMGRIARLQGLKGEVVVHVLDGVPFLVSEGMRVWFVPPPAGVRDGSSHGGVARRRYDPRPRR
jgi:hypothetical protein